MPSIASHAPIPSVNLPLGRLLASYFRHRAERRTLLVLFGMTPRQLDDLGLSPEQIEAAFHHRRPRPNR